MTANPLNQPDTALQEPHLGELARLPSEPETPTSSRIDGERREVRRVCEWAFIDMGAMPEND